MKLIAKKPGSLPLFCRKRLWGFRIVLGERIRSKVEGTEQKISAKKIIEHPKYHNFTLNFFHDLSIIYLEKDIEFNDYVQPIPLVTDPSLMPDCCKVSGWGYTRNDGQLQAF